MPGVRGPGRNLTPWTVLVHDPSEPPASSLSGIASRPTPAPSSCSVTPPSGASTGPPGDEGARHGPFLGTRRRRPAPHNPPCRGRAATSSLPEAPLAPAGFVHPGPPSSRGTAGALGRVHCPRAPSAVPEARDPGPGRRPRARRAGGPPPTHRRGGPGKGPGPGRRLQAQGGVGRPGAWGRRSSRRRSSQTW